MTEPPVEPREIALTLRFPEPLFGRLVALAQAAGAQDAGGTPDPGGLIMRGLALLEQLAGRAARGDKRMTVVWNEGMPHVSGVVLP